MDRDRVLYHFSEEADITYCSGEGQTLALRGLAILQWRGTGFSLPGPTGKWELSNGEGQDSLSRALRSLAILPWRGRGFSLPGSTGKWELSNGEGQALALR